MTLCELIADMESVFRSSKISTLDYMHIPEVRSFIERREADLIRFKEVVGCYGMNENVLTIQKNLRMRFPNESKLFGGICLNARDYFSLTKKVQKAIEDEIKAYQEQALEEMAREEYEQPNINADFAIPDELDSATFDALYGEEITG